MNTYIVLAFIVAAIALLLEWLLFARLREIAANTRETRNACETIKNTLLRIEDMYAQEHGFEDDN